MNPHNHLGAMPYPAMVHSPGAIRYMDAAPPMVAPVIQQMDDDSCPAERKGTNLGWICPFFVVFLGAVSIALFGLIAGHPRGISKIVDFKGQICGVDWQVRDQPYLYFPLDSAADRAAPSKNLLTDGRCVESCPTTKDVVDGLVIPVTKRVWRDKGTKGAAMLFAFDIATPAHATFPAAGSYCLPLDPTLRARTLAAITPYWELIPLIGASLRTSWTLILGSTILSAFLGVMGTLLFRQFPRLTVRGIPFLISAVLIFGGLLCLSVSVRGVAGASYLFEMVPSNSSLAITVGLLMLAFGIVIPIVASRSPRHLVRAQRSLDLTGDVYVDMSNVVVAPALCALGAVVIICVWILVFVNLASMTTKLPIADEFLRSGHTEDSWELAPMKQKLSLSPGVAACAVFWTLTSWWMLELLKSLCQFAACYAGTIWYFAPPEGGEEKEMGWCPAIVAMSLGLSNHFGTFVLGSLVMWATSGIRTVGSWASAKNDEHPDEFTAFMSGLFGPLKEPIRSVVDYFTSAGYVETAITSTDFWASMGVSSRRLGVPGSPSSRLFSCLDSTMRYFNVLVALTTTLVAYMSITGNHSKYAVSDSTSFVLFPSAVLVVIFFVSYTICSYFTTIWSSLSDAMFYSYLVESCAPSGEVDEHPDDKLHASPQIREVIMDTVHEMGY